MDHFRLTIPVPPEHDQTRDPDTGERIEAARRRAERKSARPKWYGGEVEYSDGTLRRV